MSVFLLSVLFSYLYLFTPSGKKEAASYVKCISGLSIASGTVKLSTVHSFKGWEMQTGILIIDEDDMDQEKKKESINVDAVRKQTTDELLYTALTRIREKLIVVNIGNKKYDAFFRRNMTVCELKDKKKLENLLAV